MEMHEQEFNQQFLLPQADAADTPTPTKKTRCSRRQREQLEMIERLPGPELWEEVPHVLVLNYQPDRAIRAALLAKPIEWKPWKKESIDGKEPVTYLSYQAPNGLQVYIGGTRLPTIKEAQALIKRFSISTVLTGRIALAIWHKRRYENQLAQNGAAAIRIDEILALRGKKKSISVVRQGDHTTVRYSNGYRWDDKQDILEDLDLLQQCYVEGECTVFVEGEWQHLMVHDQYLRFTVVERRTEHGSELAGIFLTAGNWINVYENNSNIYLADVEQKVFQLDPNYQQHELRIALWLVERWRDLAKRGDYNEPVSMQEILDASIIHIDRKNPRRFRDRIHDALEALSSKGVLGNAAQCISAVNYREVEWTTKGWLASRWTLLPPQQVIEQYESLAPSSFPVLPSKQYRRTSTKKR